MHTLPKTAILLAAALGILTGCGGSDPAAVEDVTCHDFLLQYGAATGDTVTAAQGLRYIDIEPGTGTEAASGMTVDVNYSGYLVNGTLFGTSCAATEPVLRVILGANQVIPGFDQGIRGMRTNGIRRIIVPPELGYGNVANGPIPANSTLVFDLQMVRIVQ
jgi:FKBP-type peptidyl-prolyl cis-trans isomerase